MTNDAQATKVEFDSHALSTENPHGVTKDQIGLGNVDNTRDIYKPLSNAASVALDSKVDKVANKSLISSADLTKLAGIAAGAEVNVQSDWNVTSDASDAFIKNKPSLGTAASKNTGTTNGTIPIIGEDGKISSDIIPATSIPQVKSFESIEQRDTWTTSKEGDIAIVSNPPNTYVKSATGWLVMQYPSESANLNFTGSISTTDWTGTTEPYSATISVSGISASGQRPIIDLDPSVTWSVLLDQETVWSDIKRITFADNSLTFYAKKKPTIVLNFVGRQPL